MAAKKQEVPIEYLKQCFRYEDGKLYWLVRPLSHFKNSHRMNLCNSRDAGKEAGVFHKHRGGVRRVVGICGRVYYRARIVWAFHHGRWPSNFIDHENRVTTDDRIDNLRESTRSQNQFNRNLDRDSSSGLKGVSFRKDTNKWASEIRAGGVRRRLGCFPTPEEAHAAYCKAAKELHGEFACTGSSL